jgi:hypothetical protein
VLAGVQFYSTNVDPNRVGKGHSPFCQHVGRRDGIDRSYDLITAADILRIPTPDWCAHCGGYVIRRLTGTEIRYYRVAHQLLDLDERLDQELMGDRWGRLDSEAASVIIDSVSEWLDDQEQDWRVSDIRQIRRVVSDLHVKLNQAQRQREEDGPDGGSVIQFQPRK